MRDKIFGVLQKIGRSFMLPIAILPIAGLFLGIGGSFTNATMLASYGLTSVMGEGTMAYNFLSILNASGSVVFSNLSLLFAVAVAIGMSDREKATGAIAAVLGFLIKTKEGVVVYATNTEYKPLPEFAVGGEAGGTVDVVLEFECRLADGDYFVSVGVASRNEKEVVPHDRRYDSIHLQIGGADFFGLADMALNMVQATPAAVRQRGE